MKPRAPSDARDRSNIGNAKVLNAEEGDDLLTETNMTNLQFTIALMVRVPI